MSWRAALSRSVHELRVVYCAASPASAGTRCVKESRGVEGGGGLGAAGFVCCVIGIGSWPSLWLPLATRRWGRGALVRRWCTWLLLGALD